MTTKLTDRQKENLLKKLMYRSEDLTQRDKNNLSDIVDEAIAERDKRKQKKKKSK